VAGLAVSGGAGRLPDFLLIGAMKAGSTTLWNLLSQHPGIFLCTPKEPQFFSRDERYAEGLGAYARRFAGARPEQRAGEASTCYSRWPHYGDVPARIAQALPNAKLVYLLRHPVERAYSHYGHRMEERAVRGSGPLLSFEQALREIPEIADASDYWTQIQRFLAHYDRGALHVLTLDDLRGRPEPTWQALTRFLGVEPLPVPREQIDVANASGSRVARGALRRLLQRARSAPGLAALIDRVPQSARRSARGWIDRPELARVLMRGRVRQHRAQLSPLTPEARAALLARLDASTRALEEFLGRDLSEWRR
jgi:hypothetical protein